MEDFENKINEITQSLEKKLSKEELDLKISTVENLQEKHNNNFYLYFLLGMLSWKKLNLEDAIINLSKSVQINPRFNVGKDYLLIAKKEKIDLITYLTYHNPQDYTENSIIKSNQRLNYIDSKINLNKKLTDDFIIEIYNQIQKIVEEEKISTDLEISQIHRESKLKYDQCVRHFEVFNTFNVIPKNCFDCYKIQILPRNVIELIKLYIFFDNLNLKKNLTRKCMIEFRENIKEPYKGYIYCVGLEEANNTMMLLNPLLDSCLSKELPRLIKRGCSEFAEIFPSYKHIDIKHKEFMNYNPNWLDKEKIIDDKLSKIEKQKIIEDETLRGINIKDVIIIYNWLYYAKKIGDDTYKIICDDPKYSNYIDTKLSEDIINNLSLN